MQEKILNKRLIFHETFKGFGLNNKVLVSQEDNSSVELNCNTSREKHHFNP
jgi:hypothetical protein